MDTQIQHVSDSPVVSTSIESDLDGYLNVIDDATAVFRSAVDA